MPQDDSDMSLERDTCQRAKNVLAFSKSCYYAYSVGKPYFLH